MNLFRKKGLGQVHPGLNRHLRLWDLIILGIGAMVGRGSSRLRNCSSEFSWPALIISIVIAAFASAYLPFSLLNLRLASLQLVGPIVTSYAIFGEFPAWIAGWLTVMEFMTAVIRGGFRLGCLFQGFVGQSC